MMSDIHHEAVDDLKKMLISRDVQLQHKAVNIIIKTIESKKGNYKSFKTIIDIYISNEISIHLSDAVATLNIKLLRKIIYCFKYLYVSSTFYNNCYCPYVISALVRVANLHIKEDNNENIVKSILYFLCELFLRMNQNCTSDNLPIGVYDMMQIMTLLDSSMEKDRATRDVFMLCTKVLHSILSNKNISLSLDVKYVETVSNTVEKYLEKLCNTLIESESLCNDKISYIFGMICYIGMDALEFSYILSKSKAVFNKHTSSDFVTAPYQSIIYVEKIVNIAQKAIQCVIENLKKLSSYLTFTTHEVLLKFVSIYLQGKFNQKIASNISQFLVENDFLVYLPRLRLMLSQNQNIQSLCQSNLVEIIVILSNESFNLSQWNGGKEAFKNYIYEGLLNSNKNFNLWPQKLYGTSLSDPTLNTVIIYLYFYCLSTKKSQVTAQALLPGFVHYILSLPSNMDCSVLILKCLWLLFAMAYNSKNVISNTDIDEFEIKKANYKLSHLVLPYIDDVYTHHISIVEWAYSSTVSFETQYKVLSMWLKNEKNIPLQLMSLTSTWWSLLEIIRMGFTSCAVSAMEIFKSSFQHYCDEENIIKIKTAIWESLPNMLSAYAENGNIQDEEVLMCVLDLCTFYIPESIDQRMVQESAFLLLTILPLLNKSNKKIFYFVLLETYNLLSISIEQKDTLVLLRAINSKSLLELINSTINDSWIFLSTLSCRILSFLIYYSSEYDLQSEMSFIIYLSFIANILKNERDDEKCSAVLQLFYSVTKSMCRLTPNYSPMMYFSTDFDSETTLKSYMGIFFRLQMICCKESDKQTHGAWKCLNLMVNFAVSTENFTVIKKIGSQPWTNALVRFHLSKDRTNIEPTFITFVHSWLCCIRYLKENVINNSKNSKTLRYCYNPVSKSVDVLKQTFQSKLEENLNDHMKSLITDIIKIVSYV